MFGSALIVFREVLEAALIVGIVMAASLGVPRRGAWVAGGVACGLFVAGIVAMFAETIAGAAKGFGLEFFNAGILFAAVIMLAWHQVWMSSHGKEMAQQMGALGRAVKDGGKGMSALVFVVGAAISREGSEAVLCLYGVAATDPGHGSQLLIGGLIGMLGGALCGWVLYAGILKIPAKWVFSVTGWMIVLLAAGMASQGAAFLVQAGVLPALGEQVWNSSMILTRDSALGKVMHTLVGYDDRPAGIQLVFYIATVMVIVSLSRWIGQQPASKSNRHEIAN
jgi:high-affinity iron transporter